MKQLLSRFFTLFVFTMILSGTLTATPALPRQPNPADLASPELVTMIPDHLYAPPGFDSNDNAQITITGMLPNSCYRTGPASFTVDRAKMEIVIKDQNFVYGGCWCLDVLVNYTKTIELGVLAAGAYKIVAETAIGTTLPLGKVQIAPSSSPAPDDFLYAQVREVNVSPVNGQGPRQLNLSGNLGNSCVTFKELRVLNREPNIIEVLPITEFKEASDCVPANKPFDVTATLDPQIKGETLVHIRSLNGQALNKIMIIQ